MKLIKTDCKTNLLVDTMNDLLDLLPHTVQIKQ